MTRDALVVMALALALFASALFKVWIVHVNRTTFTAVQAAHATRDEMNVEWGRLQIEQAAWSTHARIEQIAVERLMMRVVEPDAIVIVTP